MGKPYFSPSQIKTASACMRKWSGENVWGWRQADTKSTTLGKQVHKVMDEYLSEEKIPDPAYLPGALFLPGAKYLPEPKSPHLVTEQEVLIPEEVFNSGKAFFGYLDIAVLQHVDPDGSLWLLVIDGKTTSDFRWAKSEEELKRDPQALIYGWAAHQLSIGAVGYSHDKIRFKHVYFRTRGSPSSMQSSCTFTLEELREGLTDLAKFTREKMLPWDGVPFEDVPPNMNACADYGGCHLRPECAQTGLLVYGNSPEAIVTSQLMTTRLTKAPRNDNMGILTSKSLAAKAFASLLPKAEGAPAAGVNPPDGDVAGVSGIQIDPSVPPPETDEVLEEVEVQVSPDVVVAAQDILPAAVVAQLQPTQVQKIDTVDDVIAAMAAEPAQEPANPDSGYVEDPKVSLLGHASTTKGRPSEKPALWDKVERLIQSLQQDPALWAAAKAIEHTDVKKLVAGTLKLRNNVTKLDALQEIVAILDACAGGSVPDVTPTQTKGQELQTPLGKAQEQLEAATVGLVSAKAQLADNLKKLRELDQAQQESGKDEDADKYTAFNTEVYLPSRKRVTAGEAKVAEATALVAQKAEEAKAQEAAARAAQEKAAQEAERNKTADAEVAAVDRAQLSQLGKAQLVPAPLAGKRLGCTLLKGCIPTRANKGNYQHIDMLIDPYRRAVEKAAMTSYYAAIKDDGAARICSEIIVSLVNGTLQLPTYLVAPARTNYMQDRVLDALSPYFDEVFATLA